MIVDPVAVPPERARRFPAAYNLVRDHFSFPSDRVQRNDGFVVKTVGDALMAAFSHPDHGVRAALAI